MRQRVVRIAGFLVVSLVAAFLSARADEVTEVRVNDTNDNSDQRETAIARRAADSDFPNGILCAAWNDSGGMGYGYSINGGFSWVDKGTLPADPGHIAIGDPDVAFRLLDQKFYISGHDRTMVRGIAVYISPTCQASSFTQADVYRDVFTDERVDKPMMTINNWAGAPGNPRDPSKYHDRIWVTSTIMETPQVDHSPRTLAIWRSDSGTEWTPSSPTMVPPPPTLVRPYPANYSLLGGVHGPWPTVAPSGRLYVAWVRYQDPASCRPNCMYLAPIDIQVSRSTDGGNTFQMEEDNLFFLGLRNPNTPGLPPGSSCLPGLKGKIQLIPSPQIEADDLGNVHMVYVAGDPVNSADYSNVYYSRGVPGVDGGNLVWSAPVRLNTDTGSADQFMPSLMVARGSSKVAVYWYDRRLEPQEDPNNPKFQIYRRLSTNRGVTWGSNILVSDAISPPPANGSCEGLGDYNRGIADPYNLYMIWGDKRPPGTSPDTNVFFERVNIGFCTVSYCAGEGTRCSGTGSSETCCTYQSVEDPTCTTADLVPPNACPCALLQ